MLVAGLISGTSADGIDVALVRMPRLKIEAFRTVPYPRDIRKAILAASNASSISVAEISRLNFTIGELFAKAAIAVCGKRKPGLIGSHGQTIFHKGRVSTLQIGEPAVIAARTGVKTIADFRTADVAAGGEGAPLAPFLDFRLLRHRTRTRAALNIGGIANVTVIPAGAGLDQVVAFDTGPGNMVIDALVARFTAGRRKFDRGGAWAARGRVDGAVLAQLLGDPYYRRVAPKSTGREQYGAEFVDALFVDALPKLPEADLLATVTALTADTIAQALPRIDDLLVSGGGAHNRFLMSRLAAALPATKLLRAEQFGISGDAKEAVLFAVLAYETLHGRPGNVPSATGARRPVVLGKICDAR